MPKPIASANNLTRNFKITESTQKTTAKGRPYTITSPSRIIRILKKEGTRPRISINSATLKNKKGKELRKLVVKYGKSTK
tara:strand:+ start:514 stop:753 length:240 start_codon:yes stop_codon:yes gene_type:complete